ncbi:ras GTPase-activating-like protein IQGAP2 [Rana temporaria]|uniref:ras GTPase-activating-like protein IQGAP2 n=1 Tax=Rana temporaria TaxID=8407 RepID=UPI001AACBF02|nr:ras GTPase-activating-like protein IQGAP2 [Rana temporaria]
MNAIQKLREELNTWDKKISTLVNGKRRLEKVVSRYPKLKRCSRYHIEGEMLYDRQRLLELRKKTERLEPYQHLFYYLQTQPKYLSELFCQISEHEYTSLAGRLLHSLYNHAITPREEYHLMKFLENAIHYEVDKKCTNIMDILQDKCLVIRAAFSFYNQAAKCNQKLNSVIKDIVHLHYKVLGKRLNVPYMAGRVLHAIFSDVQALPYGIRYVAKVLRQVLHRKFHKATKDEVLDTLCILIYKYYLPAIVYPDRFGIIDAQLERMSKQRENLIVMAALTGITMRDSLFPTGNANGAIKDDYIVKHYPHLKSMLEDVFKIPEPEKKFGFDEYSDMISVKKPVIDIHAMDIVSTHELLSKYEKVVFPDQSDTLYNIFKALGPAPYVRELLFGEAEAAANRGKNVVEIEVCLSLDSKYIPHKEKGSDASQDAGISKVIDFQDILNNIAKDITTKNKLQLQQQAEIRKLRQAADALKASYKYYQDQVDQYQSFWNSFLENLVSQKSFNTDMTKKEKGNKEMQKETEKQDDFKILGLKEEKKQTREETRTWLHKLVSPKSPTSKIYCSKTAEQRYHC